MALIRPKIQDFVFVVLKLWRTWLLQIALETRGQFHQTWAQIKWSTAAQQAGQLFFYWWLDCLFALKGYVRVKAVCKHVDEIDPCIYLSTNVDRFVLKLTVVNVTFQAIDECSDACSLILWMSSFFSWQMTTFDAFLQQLKKY